MYCTRMDRVKDAIHPQSIQQILRDTMWVAGQFNVLQTCGLFNWNDCVLAEVCYGGERDEKVIRSASYASRNLPLHSVPMLDETLVNDSVLAARVAHCPHIRRRHCRNREQTAYICVPARARHDAPLAPIPMLDQSLDGRAGSCLGVSHGPNIIG
jgi:hypothetical protein